jgi:hypothetical protein
MVKAVLDTMVSLAEEGMTMSAPSTKLTRGHVDRLLHSGILVAAGRKNSRSALRNPTSAADLKFLHHLPLVHLRNFRLKSGTRIICLLVPFWFSKFVSEVAVLYDELRKPGTSVGPLDGLKLPAPTNRASYGPSYS